MKKAKRPPLLGRRMVASALARRSKYFRRPLHVNAVPTGFRVVRIGTKLAVADQVAPLAIWPESECYLICHARAFSTAGFAGPCDVVVCGRDWQAVQVHPLLSADTGLVLGPRLANVWILPPNAIASLKIAPGTFVATRERGTAAGR